MAPLEDTQAEPMSTRRQDDAVKKPPSARELMRLTPEERRPFLRAAVSCALPHYRNDLSRPEAERELVPDLKTGEFHDGEDGGSGVVHA